MNQYTSLREYSDQEKVELKHLLQLSISQLPFTLASPIEKLARHVDKQDYGRAMNFMLDFFEISVQYLSCVLLALIQEKEEDLAITTKHPEMIRAIQKIDTKRPLSFGDWINEIFIPLLKAAKDRIPNEPLTVSLHQHIMAGSGNLLTGSKKDASIVQIRNKYKGHSTMLSDDIYKGVVYTLEPRIFTMLKAVAPLREWTYFACKAQTASDGYRINLFNGYDSGREIEFQTAQPLEPFHCYISRTQSLTSEQNVPLLDPFPLLFCNEKNFVYVMQTLEDEHISYISSNEHAVTFTDDCWNEALDKYLQKTFPAFDVAKELNRDEVRTLAQKASRKFLDQAYREKKYNRELFVDRSRLSDYFQAFRASDKTLFPLLGEAGQGKTNQMCYWTEQLMEHNSTVLIFNSSIFAEYTLEDRLKEIFSFGKRKAVKKLLDNIHKKLAAHGEHIYFLFDAINECLVYCTGNDSSEGPLALYRDIYALLIHENYPFFKVLFTCRSYTWKNLIQPQIPAADHHTFHAGNEDEVDVRGFTDDELATAYEVYRELYQMNTPFTSLSKNKTIRLKDPLVLKIACTNYLGLELPSGTLSYTSISLFEKMLQDISRSYAGNKQCLILKELARYILREYENGRPAGSLSADLLRAAWDDENAQLHNLARLVYKNDGISVAYGELLNKPERPVLRRVEKDNGTEQLQFIYERFLEFMLASVFVERERNKLADSTENISAETFLQALRHPGTNVVFMGAMRNALIMDCLHTNCLSVIINLLENYGDDSEVILLISEVIDVLIRENYEIFIFTLLEQLLDRQPAGAASLIQKFNAINRKIESNQADDYIIGEHNRLTALLAPIIRLRKLASVSIVNGIFLTDYFNESLYQNSPFRLLWKLMADPVTDVRNDACLNIYYLSNKTYTLDYSLLKENLTQRIIREMYHYINSTPVIKIAFIKQHRSQTVIFLETATRLSTLLIIDAMLAGSESSKKIVQALLDGIRAVLRHVTLRYSLIKILMPFFQIILRRQVTFTSLYVNNVIEYQTFWDTAVIPVRSTDTNEWSRQYFKEILIFIFHYSRYFKHPDNIVGHIPDFTDYHSRILSAYQSGDSFSYFVLERLMVIMGTCGWQFISPVINSFFTDNYRNNEWFDYSQMSMLYILFQVSIYNPEANREIIALYSRECEDWTRRCRGLFKGRNSHKANPTQKYKRNVMNWYCVVYCYHAGDAAIREGDVKTVPVFYHLLDEAISLTDKELLYHLLENISELVTDYGYIQTTLELLQYIMMCFDSPEKVAAFDSIRLDRAGIYQDDLVTAVGKVLSTAKNCFTVEVDNFIRKDMSGLKFPGVPRYRGEILNYNPGGETLSDLLTHKFGNFLMWSLLNEEAVERFANEAMAMAVDAPNCFKWFDRVVRMIFRDLLKIKL